MFDEAFIYADCPELRYGTILVSWYYYSLSVIRAVLDDRKVPIEFWHEDGTFRRLDPSRQLNCRFRRRLLIFRPGHQPPDYISNCIGLRELSYELFFSKMRTPCTPIKKGLAPAATKSMLKVDDTWALSAVDFPFKDSEFARGNEYAWETGSDYESETEQFEEPNPLVILNTTNRRLYNRILKEWPKFGRYVEKVGSGEGTDSKYAKYCFFETQFSDSD